MRSKFAFHAIATIPPSKTWYSIYIPSLNPKTLAAAGNTAVQPCGALGTLLFAELRLHIVRSEWLQMRVLHSRLDSKMLA